MTVIDLSGRMAFVTGASRGIGPATTDTLIKAGCFVLANARGSDEATASFTDLEASCGLELA